MARQITSISELNFESEIPIQTYDKKVYAFPKAFGKNFTMLAPLCTEDSKVEEPMNVSGEDEKQHLRADHLEVISKYFEMVQTPTVLPRPMIQPLKEVCSADEWSFVEKYILTVPDSVTEFHRTLTNVVDYMSEGSEAEASLLHLLAASIGERVKDAEAKDIERIFGVTITEEMKQETIRKYPWLVVEDSDSDSDSESENEAEGSSSNA